MGESCCGRATVFLVHFLGSLVVGLFVLPILAPFYRLRDGFIFLWGQERRRVSSPETHRRKVAAVQEQVRAWSAGGRLRKMCTARSAVSAISFLTVDKRNLAQIDLSSLDTLVEIDEEGGTLTAEPGLKMGQLTSILAGRGWKWAIPVVPEFEALTIGGTICGAGLESGSTRFGLMADSAVGFEVVLSSGEVVNCSREENSDLFYSIPWSHGTVGFLTAAKFPLIKAGKYVKVEYHTAASIDEAQRLLETQDHVFVEGLMYGPQSFVVMHGDLVDLPPPGSRAGPVNHISRWYKPLFHNYVKGFLRKAEQNERRVHVDYIPTAEYFHRHSRSIFWTLPLGFPILNSRLYLAFFGWVLPILDLNATKALIAPVSRIGLYTLFSAQFGTMVEDYVIPMKHLRTFLDDTHRAMGCYPLWLCPTKLFNSPGMSHCAPGLESELYIDIGVYGSASKEARAGTGGVFHLETTLRHFEELTIARNGYVGTYGDMYLSREQWAAMFDMGLYEKVRAKYDCEEAFPDVYDKVIRNAIRPV